MNHNQSLFLTPLAITLLWCLTLLPCSADAETSHQVYFKGTKAQLDVYTITGSSPGPTLLLLGGIQGDEHGGYLSADLYADIALRKGNLIVVPRANFFSIVENNRGVEGDMNRKFAGAQKRGDRDLQIVRIIKELMNKSDFFLNLHDGSGFYSPKWESELRNPVRYGQSVSADAEKYTTPDGKIIRLGDMVRRVIERVNPQISVTEHRYKFNNHRTSAKDSLHKEQRLSATFHALTQVGIPAFASETSKTIKDFRQRVRYQSMVVNAFLEEFGIVPDNPSMYLDDPIVRYVVVSINGRTPIVLRDWDVLTVQCGDTVRLVHIESNYSRGLSARITGLDEEFSDLGQGVNITEDTFIEVWKDRLLIGTLPVEVVPAKIDFASGSGFEPEIRYFSVRVNDKIQVVPPGEELTVVRGDVLAVLNPMTNLPEEHLKSVKISLLGFEANQSPCPQEARGHRIDTARDLQQKDAKASGSRSIFSLQAKWNNRVIAESYIAVTEPRLEYLVLGDSGGPGIVACPGERVELPSDMLLKIMAVKTNMPEGTPLVLTMAGHSLWWLQPESAGIDTSKLGARGMPLDIARGDQSLGRIWLKQGKEFRLYPE